MILTSKSTAPDTKLVSEYTFECGNKVPIYDVTSMHGLNQLLGHAKFENRVTWTKSRIAQATVGREEGLFPEPPAEPDL